MTHRRRKSDKAGPAPDPFSALDVDFDSDGLTEGIREGKVIVDGWARDQIRRDLAGFPEWAVLEILRERGLA